MPFPTKENPNISGIKTQTPGNPLAFNELSFDDSKGAQKTNIQAQNTLNLTAKGKEQTTIGGNLTHTVAGDHVHNSHSSITYKAKNQLTVNAGAAQIQMTPSQMTVKTPSLSTGMPGNAASLPAMMPTYNKSQGSDQAQDTQSPNQNNDNQQPNMFPKVSLDFESNTLALNEYIDGPFHVQTTATVSGTLEMINTNSVNPTSVDEDGLKSEVKATANQLFAELKVEKVEGDMTQKVTMTVGLEKHDISVSLMPDLTFNLGVRLIGQVSKNLQNIEKIHGRFRVIYQSLLL